MAHSGPRRFVRPCMPASSSEYSVCPSWLLEPPWPRSGGQPWSRWQAVCTRSWVSYRGFQDRSQAVRLGCCVPLLLSHPAGLGHDSEHTLPSSHCDCCPGQGSGVGGTMRLSSCSGQQGVCGGSPERWQSELQAWGSSNLTLINSFVCAQIRGGKAS